MNLTQAVLSYDNTLIYGKDFTVKNIENTNSQILLWNNSKKEPTIEELKESYFFVQSAIDKELKSQQKKEDIEKIASISDQLNLTAGTLDIIVDLLAKDNPELLQHPWIIESKNKLNSIKEILNK